MAYMDPNRSRYDALNPGMSMSQPAPPGPKPNLKAQFAEVPPPPKKNPDTIPGMAADGVSALLTMVSPAPKAKPIYPGQNGPGAHPFA